MKYQLCTITSRECVCVCVCVCVWQGVNFGIENMEIQTWERPIPKKEYWAKEMSHVLKKTNKPSRKLKNPYFFKEWQDINYPLSP